MRFMKLGSTGRFSSTVSIALSLTAPICFCQAAITSTPAPSQAASAAQASLKPSDLLHPALSEVSQTIVELNISRWKAPGEVRAAAQQNVDSIQRDLNGTLPGLLAAADATPASVSAVFPVYRNIDALYDVLLRVSQTADLAAPQNEAASIESALAKLESARGDLGNAILSTSKSNEAEVVKLRTAMQQAAAARTVAPPKTIIVNDGPATPTSTTRHKKKPAAPSSGVTSSGSTQPQP